VRRLLYVFAALSLAAGALGLALLPHIAPNWLWFGALGAAFSAAGGGGWVLAGATAADWPRPRAGWVLLIGGLIGMAVSAFGESLFPLLWAGCEAVTGMLLIVPLFPNQRHGAGTRPGRPVQAPPVAGRHDR